MAKTFHFSIETQVSLDVEDIWPDGDAPADPTVSDVIEVIRACGGTKHVLDDWSLIDDLTLTVSDDKNSEVAP